MKLLTFFPHLKTILSKRNSFLLFFKLSTSPERPIASSAVPHCPAGPFCKRSKSSNRAKFFFKPQTPESPIFEEDRGRIEALESPQTTGKILTSTRTYNYGEIPLSHFLSKLTLLFYPLLFFLHGTIYCLCRFSRLKKCQDY